MGARGRGAAAEAKKTLRGSFLLLPLPLAPSLLPAVWSVLSIIITLRKFFFNRFLYLFSNWDLGDARCLTIMVFYYIIHTINIDKGDVFFGFR